MKIVKLILSFLIAFTSFMFVNNNLIVVNAAVEYNLYPMACGNYEVAYVSDSGGFANQGCFNDLNSAIRRMYELGNDAVVRHGASYSPSKVIAMSSGVVYSYPTRSNSNTLNVSQYENGGKTTYVTMHREMAYFNTHSYDGNGDGKVHINLNGFDGYVSLKNVDLVPMKFVRNELPIYLGGNDIRPTNEQPFSTRIYQNQYEVKQNGNYKDLVFVAHSGWSKNGWPEAFRIVVGPAADWMNVNSVYYSYNGYDFYSDREYKNKVNTYYNYYTFLPLRTKSNISVDTYNRYLSSKNISSNSKLWNTGQVFVDNQNTYGVNATIIFVMAALESGHGTSGFAMKNNNLFGWNAFDSNPSSAAFFNSINDGIREHMSINIRGYLDIKDSRFFGMHIGNKGSGLNVKYASDPYWGYKIAGISYEIDKINNNYSGNLSDYNKYSLGLINKYDVSFYSGNSTSSSRLYKSAYGATYQSNFIVPVLNQEGTMVKVQSTNGIRDNGSLIEHRVSNNVQSGEPYNWDRSIGYIVKDDITSLNFLPIDNSGKVATGDFVFTVDNMSINSNKLVLNGLSYRPGIFVNDENKVLSKVHIKSEYLEIEKDKTFDLTTTISSKDKVTYSGEIDLTSLANGRYFFKIKTDYSKYVENNAINEITDKFNFTSVSEFENKKYELVKEFGTIYLSVSDKVVEPVVTPEVTPSPTVDVTPTPEVKNELSMRNVLNTFRYKDDEKKSIIIEGYAFIKGMDANDESVVSHKLIITNMETTDKKVIDLITSSVDERLNMNDGFNYKKVKYIGEIDLTQLEIGDYHLKIQVTNDNETKSKFIVDTNLDKLVEQTTIDDKKVSFNQNQMFGYRYEISVYKHSIDKSLINKPTRRISMHKLNNLTLENQLLNINGISWMYNVNYTNDDLSQFKLGLLSLDTGDYKEYTLNTNKCDVDYAALLKSKFNRDYTCFDNKLDLSSLSDGKYLVYLDSSTKTYRDIFEINNILKPEIVSSEFDNRIYSLRYSDTRYRLELEIKTK